MPDNFKDIAENRILINEKQNLGKIKYNDKVFHQSKIIKFYVENEERKNSKRY